MAAMSFSSAASLRGTKIDEKIWELRRFASDGIVVGAASRLLKLFRVNHPEVKTVVSYSDNRWFTGEMYSKLGFELVGESGPDYAYYNRREGILHKGRLSRSNMAKKPGFNFDPAKSERQNCIENGYYKIWDCGKKKWLLKL